MRLLLKIGFLLSFIVLFATCKKDKHVLGVDVQPADDALVATFSQSTPVYAYTQTYDSILTINDRYKYLGINRDSYFGTTDVGLYLNANIPDGRTFVSFGDDAQLTSAEIILTAYNLGSSYAGSATGQVSYSVYPISTAPDPTKVYYSNDNNFADTRAVLGTYTGLYSAINGTLVLRIPMDKNFAKSILNNPQWLYDNTTFQTVYKGFYIKCSLNGDDGTVTMFDLEDDLSGFYLYYQNGTPSATKTDKVFKFTFGGVNPVRFNTVKHNFQGGNNLLIQQVVNHDTTKGADDLFLKGLGVSKVKVEIPFLKSYSDSFQVAVNRAEVVFNVDPAFTPTTGYAPPPKLCLLPLDSIGREIFALDQTNVTDAARYDGTYDATNLRYVFNIARHVQAVLDGKIKNYGFCMVVANADDLLTYNNIYNGDSKELFLVRRDANIERVVLAGSNKGTLKPTFNLSYIKIRHDK